MGRVKKDIYLDNYIRGTVMFTIYDLFKIADKSGVTHEEMIERYKQEFLKEIENKFDK